MALDQGTYGTGRLVMDRLDCLTSISRRHRGAEKSANEGAALVDSVRRGKAKVRLENVGPIRSSQASGASRDSTAPSDEAIPVSPRELTGEREQVVARE